jgi:hypothetical protein
MIARLFAAGLLLVLASQVYAQGNAAAAPPQDPTERPTFEDQVVVSASIPRRRTWAICCARSRAST